MMTPNNGDGRPGQDGQSQCLHNNPTPEAYVSVIPSASSRLNRRARLCDLATAIAMDEVAVELDQGGRDLGRALEAAAARLAADFAAARHAAAGVLLLVEEVER